MGEYEVDTSSEYLSELLPAAREGIEFYEFAEHHAEPSDLRVVFASMAQVKHDLVCALNAELLHYRVRKDRMPRLSESAQRTYAAARRGFGSLSPVRYLNALIDEEERILEALHDTFEQARFDENNPRVADILRRHLPRMHACHEAMQRARVRMAISG